MDSWHAARRNLLQVGGSGSSDSVHAAGVVAAAVVVDVGIVASVTCGWQTRHIIGHTVLTNAAAAPVRQRSTPKVEHAASSETPKSHVFSVVGVIVETVAVVAVVVMVLLDALANLLDGVLAAVG
jgi:hypothetical protein